MTEFSKALRRIAAFLLAALLVCISLSACESPRKESPGADADGYVCFTDALGREVAVRRSPERVAALIGSFADVWMLAGGEVVATADDAWEDFGLELDGGVINLGATKSPSLESLLSARPDLVIASAATAKNVEWCDLLESAGICVVYFDVSGFEDYLEMLDVCTQITGRRDLYEQNGLAVKERVDSIRAVHSEKMGGRQPKVLFLRASAGYIRAKNSHSSVLGEMLAALGCINIADSDSSLLESLSVEVILREDPEYVFVVQVGDDAGAVRENVNNMMKENAAWQELSAVREGRLFYLDKRLFNLKPNALWAQAYEELSAILQN